MGVMLACGEGAVLSHGSAAPLWGIFKRWEMPFEVTAPSTDAKLGTIMAAIVAGHVAYLGVCEPTANQALEEYLARAA